MTVVLLHSHSGDTWKCSTCLLFLLLQGSSPEMDGRDPPPDGTTSNPPLTLHTLLSFARQIAMGMVSWWMQKH